LVFKNPRPAFFRKRVADIEVAIEVLVSIVGQ
jgi:hypothetical protein